MYSAHQKVSIKFPTAVEVQNERPSNILSLVLFL